jgi:hypothetical protein
LVNNGLISSNVIGFAAVATDGFAVFTEAALAFSFAAAEFKVLMSPADSFAPSGILLSV